jgi:beta-phosphoglucomutase-like phosphatase (HAD superfamily)
MSNLPAALLFDVDGTMADTERDGHRVAYNNTFKDFGLDWFWSVEEYGELLAVTGGKERMRFYLRRLGKSADDDLIRQIYAAKSTRFQQMIHDGELKLRPGVKRILESAWELDIPLAVATTTNPGNVTSLLASNLGEESIGWFSIIAAGDVVASKKPAPDVYQYALNAMGIGPQGCVALEDSANGLCSSLAAGLSTLIAVTDYTAEEDFTGAALVVDHFGDPGNPASIIHNPTGISFDEILDIDVLAQIAHASR